MLKRLVCALCAAAFIFCFHAFADETPPAYSYVLMEGGTETLLYSENGEARVRAHHSAKLMTLLLTAEAIDSGRMSLDTLLKTSQYANSMQGAQIWLMPNEEITVRELVAAITVGNANDAAVVLAEGVGGSEEKFVKMMNEKAEQLGMSGTSYSDCTGISADSVTTACDCAILASELAKISYLREFFTTWVTSVRGGKTELASTNRLILTYEGLIGTKAYYADDLGNCLIAAAERDGLIMVCVIFGESDEFRRFATAKEKLNTGFNAYSLFKPKRSDVYPEPVKVRGGEFSEVDTELSRLSGFIVRKSAEENIEIKIEYSENVAAPLSAGDKVGRAVWYVGEEEIYSCPIVAKFGVRKMNFFIGMKRALESLIKM